jgi:hypothetical protein
MFSADCTCQMIEAFNRFRTNKEDLESPFGYSLAGLYGRSILRDVDAKGHWWRRWLPFAGVVAQV